MPTAAPSESMTPSKAGTVHLAAFGFLSATPVMVAGFVLQINGQSPLGAVLLATAFAFGVFSAIRARRIRLTLNETGIHIVNRWRTYSVAFADFGGFEDRPIWWGMFTGSAEVLCVLVRGRVYSIEAQATYGVPLQSPQIQGLSDRAKVCRDQSRSE